MGNAKADHESAEKLGRVTGELEVLRRRLHELSSCKVVEDSATAERVKDLEAQLQAGETVRRKMHNLIQELRGNVRVFARVRPFLPNDNHGSQESCISTKSDGLSLRITNNNDEHNFAFDKVFGPSMSQVYVYLKYVT